MLLQLYKKLTVLIASGISCIMITAGANAAVYVGDLTGSPFSGAEMGSVFQPTLTPNAPFSEIYGFTASAPISLSTSAEVIELNSLFMVTGFSFALVENTAPGNDFSTFDTLASGTPNATGGLDINFDGLEPGNLYGLLFEGVAGIAGGIYAAVYATAPDPNVSAVPIPTVLPLLISSTIGLLFIARRKRPTS